VKMEKSSSSYCKSPDPCLTKIGREAYIVFKAGKNWDGYFDADDLLAQVDKAINIFEECMCGFAMGLFLFDNAPSHQKCASNAVSAH